jgi:hypothetical protein
MYKLFVADTKSGTEKVLEFSSYELACLYRDYHLTFGTWSNVSKWVSEKEISEAKKKFIVEEKYIGVEKFFKIADGFEIKIQKENAGTIEEAWAIIRKKRNLKLQESDWTQLADVVLDTDERKNWRAYRSYLRDFTKLHNETSISHAKLYSFEEWKSGKR